MADQKVRLIKPWGLHVAGEQFTVTDSIAVELIKSGRAEAVPEPEQTKPEAAKGNKATKGNKGSR